MSKTPQKRLLLPTSSIFLSRVRSGVDEYNTPQGGINLPFFWRFWPPDHLWVVCLNQNNQRKLKMFKFKENANTLALKEEIYSRIAKAKAITTCILSLSDNHELKSQSLHDIIWAVDGYLEDLMSYYDKLDEMIF